MAWHECFEASPGGYGTTSRLTADGTRSTTSPIGFSATRSATQKALCRLYDAGAVDKRSVDFNGTRRQGLTHAAEWRAVEIEED